MTNPKKPLKAWWIMPSKNPRLKTWFCRRVEVLEISRHIDSARIQWIDPRTKCELATWTPFTRLATTREKLRERLEQLKPDYREELATRREQLALRL